MIANTFSSFVQDTLLLEHAYNGFELSFWTFVITVVFELWSFDTVKKIWEQDSKRQASSSSSSSYVGKSLYKAAIIANVKNHFAFGWFIYAVAASLFCRRDADAVTNSQRLLWIVTILTVHSLCFYYVHKTFHMYPHLYKHHKFHHQFNTYVTPIAANAVSTVEYLFAYTIPFTFTMPLIRPDTFSVQVSVFIVSLTNILIHTPKLQALSEQVIPKCFVSTADHLDHHKKLTTHFAAPTLNIDYFVEVCSSFRN